MNDIRGLEVATLVLKYRNQNAELDFTPESKTTWGDVAKAIGVTLEELSEFNGDNGARDSGEIFIDAKK